MTAFVLQMAGESGSGKSTLARAIGEATGAVVIDQDVIKSGLLTQLSEDHTSGLAYELFFDVAGSLARQGHNIILDSPAFDEGVLQRGREIAEAAGADYRIIECICDEEELSERLESRPRLESQPSAMAQVILQRIERGRSVLLEPHLMVETSQPLDVCLSLALGYLGR